MELLSFHNYQSIKDKYVERVKYHRDHDNIIQGIGWENGKGCAVGCTLENYDHTQYPIELGIPQWLARIEDTIFEGLSNKDAMEWPLLFLQSIPVGIDLNKIKNSFLVMVVESVVDKFDHDKYPKVLECINNVLKLLKSNDYSDFTAYAAYAAYAAHNAAAYAPDAAAYAVYAAYSAYAAYDAYADDDDDAAAYAAAYASAAAAEKEKTYKMFSEKLIDLLKNCK